MDVDAQVEELTDLLIYFCACVGYGACLGDFFGDVFIFLDGGIDHCFEE